jgi:amidohydrolase
MRLSFAPDTLRCGLFCPHGNDMRKARWLGTITIGAALLVAGHARADIALGDMTARVDAATPKVVAWRRDIHAHPELGNRETRTAALVAAHLRRLGMEVRTNVAATGVVAVLRGGRAGPVVALRAELDALPVQEQTGLPFASTVQTTYDGQQTYVAHVCGHDMHIAMLMGAAEVLAGMRADLPGTVVFVFQPAEEGPPAGEEGGADRMIAERAFDDPAPSAIFGVHVVPGPPGTISYRPGGAQAGADEIQIALHGRGTHGAWPWEGVDVISLSSAIVSEFNTLAARTVDVTKTPTVLSITTIQAGNRSNIIPTDIKMAGTLRTFDEAQRKAMMQRIETTVRNLAAIYGATAQVQFANPAAITINDPALAAWALPALTEAAGQGKVDPAAAPTMAADDFASYRKLFPGLLVDLGISADGADPATTPPNHSPRFDPNEAVLPLGVRAYVLFTVRYLESGGAPTRTSAAR